LSQPLQDAHPLTLSTQAFLILCRLFDQCYDELKQQEHLQELVESIADTFLSGVTVLEEQVTKPKNITFPLSIRQAFFLRRLVAEILLRTPHDHEDGKTSDWLKECLTALERVGMPGAFA
jgi:hypothetical protein